MTRTEALRVVAISDADSFVKWAAALLDSVPGIRRRLVLLRTPLTLSAAQEKAALADTSFTEDAVIRLGFDDLPDWLDGHRPDVVVLAARGPLVRLVMRQIDRLPQRPVVISGLPGMSIPAQRGALEYRRESDLLVVHSHREQRAFEALGRRLGLSVPTALATLPYARAGVARVDARTAVPVGASVRASVGDGTREVARAPGAVVLAERPRAGTDLVFAAQALVPGERAERAVLAEILRRAALADPTRRVVVKLRSRPGEVETHLERDGYAELLADRPSNLVFSYQPMAEALAQAEGLVTVSSTAAIEAIGQGVPVIAVDTFGVAKPLLNTVFAGSGLLGDAEDVVARRFRHPHRHWMHDNYFHPAEESDWWTRVQELVTLRRAGMLPAKTVPVGRGGALRGAWHRASVLGAEDRSLLGRAALAVGAPVVRSILALRRARGRAGEDTWADPTTDYTLEPTPHRDPIRR